MNCPRCGSALPAHGTVCPTCGLPFGGTNPFGEVPQQINPSTAQPGYYAPPGKIGDDVAMRLVIPVGTSGWAIAAGYLGLLSLSCIGGFLGPFAIFTGIMAIRHMKRNPKIGGWARAIFGIVTGAIGTLGFVAFIATFLLK